VRNEIGVEVKNMNKFLASIMLSAIAFSVLVLVGSANADHNPSPHPAQNADQCRAAGGEFSRDTSTTPPTNTCVITEEDSTETVPATHPSGNWKVDVTTPGSTETYTAQGSTRTHTSTGGGDPVVTACYNSQGKPIGDFENNPNCQPA
jgi:hypothetical protein